MQVVNGTIEGRNAILDYLENRPDPVPAEIRDKLREASREVPVVACDMAARLIYARRDECPASLQDLGAALAATMGGEGFHGWGVDGLGLRTAAVLRREAGTLPEGVEAPEPAADPAPDPAYVKPAPPPAPPAP